MTAGSSREAIMTATFTALSEHGYADITIQAIADEFEKSKSLILYHYDSKDALMTAFMEWILEEFLDRVEGDQSDDPATRLRRMARLVIGVDEANGTDAFHTALLELRAQAPYNEALRAQLVENDRRIRERIAADVREGIERGQFRPVDPESFAAAFRSAIEGAESHAVILGDDAPNETALAGIDERFIQDLLRADVEEHGDDGVGGPPVESDATRAAGEST